MSAKKIKDAPELMAEVLKGNSVYDAGRSAALTSSVYSKEEATSVAHVPATVTAPYFERPLLNDRMVFEYDEYGPYELNPVAIGNPLKYKLYDTTDFSARRNTPAQTCTHARKQDSSTPNWHEMYFSDRLSHYVEAVRIWPTLGYGTYYNSVWNVILCLVLVFFHNGNYPNPSPSMNQLAYIHLVYIFRDIY